MRRAVATARDGKTKEASSPLATVKRCDNHHSTVAM